MNNKKYYLYRLFEDLMPIYPLYLLMFENKGLTVAQISLLLAIWSIPAVILELPTGILADKWSRKKLIVLGGLLKALCYFTWMLPGSFFIYALGFIFWGIGGALRSGSEEALLFDSLKVQKEEEKFDLIYGRGHFLSGISNILASVAGGFIGAQFGYQTALGLSVMSGVITAGIAASMEEVNLYKVQKSEKRLNKGEETFRKALAFLLKNKEILLFSLLTILVMNTAGILDEYDQLIAKEFGLSMRLIGIWAAIRFLLTAFGSMLARGIRIAVEKLTRCRDRMNTIRVICITAAIFLILAGMVRRLGIMTLYGLYYLLMSAGEVLQEDYVQQKIGQEGRSTVHSLISLSQNLYGIVLYGLFGFAVSFTGLFTGLTLCGIYIVLWTVIIGILHNTMKEKVIGHKPEECS